MPNFAFICDEGHMFDKHLPLSEYDKPVSCDCGLLAHKDYSQWNIGTDNTLGYFDTGLGTYIESTSDRRRIERSRGLEAVSGSEEVMKYRGKPKEPDIDKLIRKAHDKVSTVTVK